VQEHALPQALRHLRHQNYRVFVNSPVFAGVEAGGGKFVCATGAGPEDLVRQSIPTTTPSETFHRVVQFFRARMETRPIAALGVATFGPVDLDPGSPTFGFITSTPKPGWSNFDIRGTLYRALGLPVAIDTDVNAAALAESRWGAAQGLDPVLYVTVGTGIGGGAVIHGVPLHGAGHPEMGHMLVPHDLHTDPFPGACPYHGDCLEGLASGFAMARRWGVRAEALPADHPGWALEAHYLALGLANLACILSPRRIILGGGVMHHRDLLPMIRENLREVLRGYVQAPEIEPPALGDDAGVLGALILAETELRRGADQGGDHRFEDDATVGGAEQGI
jgi:fructokinase